MKRSKSKSEKVEDLACFYNVGPFKIRKINAVLIWEMCYGIFMFWLGLISIVEGKC